METNHILVRRLGSMLGRSPKLPRSAWLADCAGSARVMIERRYGPPAEAKAACIPFIQDGAGDGPPCDARVMTNGPYVFQAGERMGVILWDESETGRKEGHRHESGGNAISVIRHEHPAGDGKQK